MSKKHKGKRHQHTSYPDPAAPSTLRPSEREVIESPDGDPAKRGTIVAAVSLGSATGPLDLVPAPADHPARRTEKSVVVAQRKTELLIAHDLPAELHALYGESGEVRDAVDAIHESERRRR